MKDKNKDKDKEEKIKRLKVIEAKAIAYMRGEKEDCFVKKYLKKLYQQKTSVLPT